MSGSFGAISDSIIFECDFIGVGYANITPVQPARALGDKVRQNAR